MSEALTLTRPFLKGVFLGAAALLASFALHESYHDLRDWWNPMPPEGVSIQVFPIPMDDWIHEAEMPADEEGV